MAPKLIAVLCLGLCLGQKICTHAGAPDRLSLSARPSPVVPLGGRVTLSCDSHRRFVLFTIYKTSGTHYRELHTGRSNNFTISPVTSGHAGIYRCSGSYGRISQWSALHSNSLMVVVTGAFRKPSISAHPSSLVAAGARVTLRCHSELAFDEFILYKEGHTQHSQELDEGMEAGIHYVEAVFRVGPVTPAHAGAYRCCGSFRHSRYECSAPSDPLEIVITGKHKKPSLCIQVDPMMGSGENVTLLCISEISFDRDPLQLSVTGDPKSTHLLVMEPTLKSDTHLPQGQSSNLNILIGLSVAVISIGTCLSAFIGYWCSIKYHTPVANTEPMEGQQMDEEDPAAGAAQEMLYAQLNQHTLSQRGVTPTLPCPDYLSEEPSIYITVHQA
ncbi:putative killer cell immunoglobulin-like receptor-like protein KIR3DX1 [Plecturocebus cupreus]